MGRKYALTLLHSRRFLQSILFVLRDKSVCQMFSNQDGFVMDRRRVCLDAADRAEHKAQSLIKIFLVKFRSVVVFDDKVKKSIGSFPKVLIFAL